jgi:hypothetical protein
VNRLRPTTSQTGAQADSGRFAIILAAEQPAVGGMAALSASVVRDTPARRQQDVVCKKCDYLALIPLMSGRGIAPL